MKQNQPVQNSKIHYHKYAAYRQIEYPGLTRQRFKLLCKTMSKEMPDYFDGPGGERTIVLKVAKYIPTSEEFIEEAHKRNAALADEIMRRLTQMHDNGEIRDI